MVILMGKGSIEAKYGLIGLKGLSVEKPCNCKITFYLTAELIQHTR